MKNHENQSCSLVGACNDFVYLIIGDGFYSRNFGCSDFFIIIYFFTGSNKMGGLKVIQKRKILGKVRWDHIRKLA